MTPWEKTEADFGTYYTANLGSAESKKPLGLIVLHSYTAIDARENERFCNALLEMNPTLAILRAILPQHENDATTDGLKHFTLSAAKDYVLQCVQELRKTCDQVVLLGQSLGGMLSLWMGTEHANELDGVILLSSSLQSGLLQSMLEKSHHESADGFTWMSQNYELYKEFPSIEKEFHNGKRIHQLLFYVPTLQEIQVMTDALRPRLDVEFKKPILIIHSTKDDLMPPKCAQEIYDHVGTSEAEKQLLILEEGNHILTRDKAAWSNFMPAITEFLQNYKTK